MRQTGTFPGDLMPEPRKSSGTVVATLLGAVAFIPGSVTPPLCLERPVFSCDYNGWADVPEDEREAIEAFESAREISANPQPSLPILISLLPSPVVSQRKAA
jgi:hypothetical protein